MRTADALLMVFGLPLGGHKMDCIVRLSIELVPRGAWFRNLRSLLPVEQWNSLRKATYRRVGYRCEICLGKGTRHPVECHEKWEYDDKHHIAKLIGLYGLCPACHECKHIGLAQVKGRLHQARKHLADVNGVSEDEAAMMIYDAFQVWERRSEHDWDVDISWASKAMCEQEQP